MAEVQDHDTVDERANELHVMLNQHERHPPVGNMATKKRLQTIPFPLVEPRRRLIEQEEIRLSGDGPGHIHKAGNPQR